MLCFLKQINKKAYWSISSRVFLWQQQVKWASSQWDIKCVCKRRWYSFSLAGTRVNCFTTHSASSSSRLLISLDILGRIWLNFTSNIVLMLTPSVAQSDEDNEEITQKRIKVGFISSRRLSCYFCVLCRGLWAWGDTLVRILSCSPAWSFACEYYTTHSDT